MNERTWVGIIAGVNLRSSDLWGALYQALPVGGLVTLAAAAVGFGGAVGGGGLLALFIAACPNEEKKEARLFGFPEEIRTAA